MLPLFLLFGAVTAAPDTLLNAPVKVDLAERQVFTRSNGDADLSILININRTLMKYQSKTLLPSYEGLEFLPNRGLKKRQSNEPLGDEADSGLDYEYQGPLSIRRQTFVEIFDTGSADLLVPGPSCNSTRGCPNTAKYDQCGINQRTNTTIEYVIGSARGANYIDTVTVAGLTARNQGLISITSATDFADPYYDGILGMAFGTIAKSKFTPFFENLMGQNQVKKREFSFYLGRAISNTGQNSQLTLGGRDTSKFTGGLTTVPVTVQRYWQIALDSVKMGGTIIASSGQAIIDTGTTLLLAPPTAAASIFDQIPGTFSINLGPEGLLYAYPCNMVPKCIPVIQLAGVDFAIAPDDFNFGRLTVDFARGINDTALVAFLSRTRTAYCLAGIVGIDLATPLNSSQDVYVLGDVFMKNWYSVFSYDAAAGKPAVLFAKSI